MKNILLLICVILILNSCSEDLEIINSKIYGKWVTIEIEEKDGSKIEGPLTGYGIFGAYSESIQLNTDNTFVPLMQIDADNFVSSTSEAGTFLYQSQFLELNGGAWDMDFNVVKLNDADMWLKTSERTYKLNRVE